MCKPTESMIRDVMKRIERMEKHLRTHTFRTWDAEWRFKKRVYEAEDWIFENLMTVEDLGMMDEVEAFMQERWKK